MNDDVHSPCPIIILAFNIADDPDSFSRVFLGQDEDLSAFSEEEMIASKQTFIFRVDTLLFKALAEGPTPALAQLRWPYQLDKKALRKVEACILISTCSL